MNWHNPVRIQSRSGLLKTIQFEQSFIILADPNAVSSAFKIKLEDHWGPQCIAWFNQPYAKSSIESAISLCGLIWPLMMQHPKAALLAIGGGTTLDLAKIIRYRLIDLNFATEVWRSNKLPQQYHRHTLWCAPTTSGTGSEVTPWATLWDLNQQTPEKRSWSQPAGFPELALLDPELTQSCPVNITRDTALDALAHALESIWNTNAHPITRTLAIESAKTLLLYLPQSLDNLTDLHYREKLSHASLLAGLAMSQTQTALAHALSYDLTLNENMSHGHACAIWLPMCMDISSKQDTQVRDALEQIFECSVNQANQKLIDWLNRLEVETRDLRSSPDGKKILRAALTSQRGKNFIGHADEF